MPEVTWTHEALPLILRQIPEDASSLVDIGCGRGIIGACCSIYRDMSRTAALEVHPPYVEFVRSKGYYDECRQWDLRETPLPFGDQEFDVATCIEVIEHLDRRAGLRLLAELERIAERVVVTTPTWFFRQHDYDRNSHQRHLSLWTVRDFRNRGYAIYGVGGLKVFGRPVRFLSAAFAPITRYAPRLSSIMLCTRDVPSRHRLPRAEVDAAIRDRSCDLISVERS